jgi:hypothetical protein
MRRWYLYSWGDDFEMSELPDEAFDARCHAVYVLESERLTPEESLVLEAAKRWKRAGTHAESQGDDTVLAVAVDALEASER